LEYFGIEVVVIAPQPKFTMDGKIRQVGGCCLLIGHCENTANTERILTLHNEKRLGRMPTKYKELQSQNISQNLPYCNDEFEVTPLDERACPFFSCEICGHLEFDQLYEGFCIVCDPEEQKRVVSTFSCPILLFCSSFFAFLV